MRCYIDGAEDAEDDEHDCLAAPHHDGIGNALGVADAVEREGEHYGHIPGAETAVGWYCHAERAEDKHHQARYKAVGAARVGEQSAGEGEGMEADIRLKEIACPYTERQYNIPATALHREEHLEALPCRVDRPVDFLNKTIMAEEI